MRIDFQQYQFNLQEASGSQQIFDPLRKKFVALTPEEWVRQHWIQYMIQDLNYPKGRMCSEISLNVNGTSKRADLAIFDRDGKAQLILECKAPEVNIDQSTLDQILRYNLPLKARYFILSNGKEHHAFELLENGDIKALEELPASI